MWGIFAIQVASAWDINTYLSKGIDNVMHYYDSNSGLWYDPNCVQADRCNGQFGWWYWANMVRLLSDYEKLTGKETYNKYILNTYQKNHTKMLNRPYFDDEGWWALALIAMYNNTRDIKYVRAAEAISDDMHRRGHQSVCFGNGGIYWDAKKTQVGSIANGLYLGVNAKLYLITRKKKYETRALDTWSWFQRSGLISKDWSIYDHYNIEKGKCGEKITWRFTYAYGVIFSGLADLTKATHNRHYLVVAKEIANKAMDTFSVDGVLTETCSNVLDCADDMFLFKGIFAYDLAYLANSMHDKKFHNKVKLYLNNNYKQLLFSHRQSKSNTYAFIWSSPPNLNRKAKGYNPSDIVTQMAALFLFNANLLIHKEDHEKHKPRKHKRRTKH